MSQYLTITEIRDHTLQGRTKPFMCSADDQQQYIVKGKSACIDGCIKEWMGAKLATAFGLPVPRFTIIQVDEELLELHDKAASGLGNDPAFASQYIPLCSELRYDLIPQVDKQLRRNVLMFDAWVRNEDRTLTEYGGNPNLIWSENTLYVIDHNLIFDNTFNTRTFLETHIFKEEMFEILHDFLIRGEYEQKMQAALNIWSSALNALPTEWCKQNEEYGLFDPEATFRQLQDDAQGAIWARLMQ